MSALTTPQEPPQNRDARHSQHGVVSLELHDPRQTLLEPDGDADDHHLPDNRVRGRSQPAALLGSAPRRGSNFAMRNWYRRVAAVIPAFSPGPA